MIFGITRDTPLIPVLEILAILNYKDRLLKIFSTRVNSKIGLKVESVPKKSGLPVLILSTFFDLRDLSLIKRDLIKWITKHNSKHSKLKFDYKYWRIIFYYRNAYDEINMLYENNIFSFFLTKIYCIFITFFKNFSSSFLSTFY